MSITERTTPATTKVHATPVATSLALDLWGVHTGPQTVPSTPCTPRGEAGSTQSRIMEDQQKLENPIRKGHTDRTRQRGGWLLGPTYQEMTPHVDLLLGPLTRKRHKKDLTHSAKGRTGDCLRPYKETSTGPCVCHTGVGRSQIISHYHCPLFCSFAQYSQIWEHLWTLTSSERGRGGGGGQGGYGSAPGKVLAYFPALLPLFPIFLSPLCSQL